MQAFNLLFSRLLNNTANLSDYFRLWPLLKTNPNFLGVLAAILVIQLILIESVGSFFKTAGVSIENHAACMLIGLGGLLWGIGAKAVVRKLIR
jgi:hypothetical protein